MREAVSHTRSGDRSGLCGFATGVPGGAPCPTSSLGIDGTEKRRILCLTFGFERKNNGKSKRALDSGSKIQVALVALSDARQPAAPSPLRVGPRRGLPFSAVVLEGTLGRCGPRGLAHQWASRTWKRNALRRRIGATETHGGIGSVPRAVFSFMFFPGRVENLGHSLREVPEPVRHAGPSETAAWPSSDGRRCEVGTRGDVPRSERGPKQWGGRVLSVHPAPVHWFSHSGAGG